MLKKIKGGILLMIGYMLSPLSWWNDLFFNLPIAYLFGYTFSLFDSNLLMPCTIIGYWISNVVGIVMMQFGVQDVFQDPEKVRNPKKDILIGLTSSTAYTFLIIALIQLKWIETPSFLFSSFN